MLDDATGNWVEAKPNPDAFVVNIGDMLAMCKYLPHLHLRQGASGEGDIETKPIDRAKPKGTKNIYKSNTHRVINKSTRDRYSVPFFFDGNADVVLSPLDGSAPAGGRKAPTVAEHMLDRFSTTYKDPGVAAEVAAAGLNGVAQA